ncbi:F-box/WD repeat-containing protein 4-like [Amphiura filiformis]|uniref:F-box/WD repeat-containing protein 4-like n=1 Tax=Amphiura filiformis TaxID=82378 RepID=UPI003B20BBEE
MSGLSLLDLPDELLYEIFSYLTIVDLGRISQVCWLLRQLSGHDAVWRRISKRLINIHDEPRARVTLGSREWYFGVPLKERCRVSLNWVHGQCQDVNLKTFSTHLLPWLQLDDTNLYISQGEMIKRYQILSTNGDLAKRSKVNLFGHQDDVCRFVIHGDQVVAGGRDCSVLVWNKDTGQLLQNLQGCTDEAICVDMTRDVVIAGARNGFINMWNKTSGQCKVSLPVGDRVWSLQVSPWQSCFASGSSSCYDLQPLKLWDIQSGELTETLGRNYRKGAGILDIQWETPYTLLACGYDAYIRLWDTRASVHAPVMKLEEPDDYTMYCMQTDKKHLIASGSSLWGVVRLWDKRMTHTMQSFFVGHNCNSPIYSLQFNSTHLYAALCNSLRVLNFKAGNAVSSAF